MKHLGIFLTLAALGGCATHRASTPVSTDWDVVQRLRPGTNVVTYLRGTSRAGAVEAVTPDGLVLRDAGTSIRIARDEVMILARRTPMPHERRWNMVTGALVFSMAGALFLPAIDDDLAFMAIVAGSGAAIGATERSRHNKEKTIYVRADLR